MNVNIETVGDVVIVSPQGKIDALSAGSLQERIDELLRGNITRMILHVAQVPFVSSSGLRVFIQAAKKLHGSGRCVVSGLNPEVRQVFELAGFDRIMTLCADLDTAKVRVMEST